MDNRTRSLHSVLLFILLLLLPLNGLWGLEDGARLRQYSSGGKQRLAGSQSERYQIVFGGSWSVHDKAEVLHGVIDVSRALAAHTRRTPEQSFNCIYGEVIFRAKKIIPGGYLAYAVARQISIEPGRAQSRLVVHELGHVFDYAVQDSEHPSSLLACYGIVSTSGDKVTGTWFDGYLRHLGKTAPANGYRSDHWRDGYQMHPVSTSGGNSPAEDWADIFLNWVYQAFAGNEAGEALYTWADGHMAAWTRPCAADILD